MNKIWVMIGAISGFISVAMGAFGTHTLSGKISPDALTIFRSAAQYEMVHALALIGLGCWGASHPQLSTKLPGWSFVVGSAIFSGSLYALSVSGLKILGAITPIGGLAFMLGWLSFAWKAWKS